MRRCFVPFLLIAAAPALAESLGSADLLLQLDDAAPPVAEATTNAIYGDPDSGWWWTVGAGGGASLNNGEAGAAAFVGASSVIARDLEFSADLTRWYLTEDHPNGDDAVALNLNPKLRWHFIAEESYTLFLEAGVGLLIATDEVPEGGSEFNFTPQAGAGVTFPLSGGPDRLVVGVNWRHFSNANSFGSERNPGRDDVYAYIGVTFPF
jgi:hypothetical protein